MRALFHFALTTLFLSGVFIMPAHAEKQSYTAAYAQDRAEIEDLMARYLFALDWNDLDTFIDMFTEDAEFEYARGTAVGKADILATVTAFKKAIGERYKDDDGNPAILRHVLGQTAIRIEGDKAWTRAFWYEMANNGPGKTLKMGTFGLYEDELVKVDGEWKFSKRRILNEFLPGRESSTENPVLAMDRVAVEASK
ncbi:nuclear transport factor 2 family protein [Altericroceibacterium spongiae]|uniref:Nuclear transport factor 2 family protein n=1 Tax=Altericroceibacterium spongiae TaxID=2320269 RepID=A0A420EPV9_9SPHN|nr:nuclear transport factor 2 family protein [Altericroceibacterium spongiae]RKF22708.1 nuclear transport factor 2 family protein [Altericroceibacterium spongiae]